MVGAVSLPGLPIHERAGDVEAHMGEVIRLILTHQTLCVALDIFF
jgi:hypothetical protein